MEHMLVLMEKVDRQPEAEPSMVETAILALLKQHYKVGMRRDPINVVPWRHSC